jgi:TRAP-type C4-dicarboxylate transport system permease small subunit
LQYSNLPKKGGRNEVKYYYKLLNIIEKVLTILLIVMFSIMVLTMFYQVIMRYAFHNAPVWTDEFTKFLNCYSVLLGSALATRKGSHLLVDVLINLFKPKVRYLMVAISTIAGIGVLIILFKYGINLCVSSSGMFAGLKVKMSYIYASIPIGCVLMILFSIEVAYKNFKAAITGIFPDSEKEATI